jgi:hypothetical protein
MNYAYSSTFAAPELLSDPGEDGMRRCLLSVVAVAATYLNGLRLLLPDRVRKPTLRRSNASTLAPISPRKCLFARRVFNSPLSHRRPCKVHHTSMGIFSSIIAELDETIAVLVYPSCCYYY